MSFAENLKAVSRTVTSAFGFTNTDAKTIPLTGALLHRSTDYALISDEPTECVTSNITCPVDQEEILSYRCKKIPTVNTAASVQYPNPVKKGVQYTVSLDDVLRSESDDGIVIDHPIVAYLVVRHDLSGDITDAHINTVVGRLVSACSNDAGESLWSQLRRSALKPTTD